MGYKIEGDGSYQHTRVWKDGKKIDFARCDVRINLGGCSVIVDDGDPDMLDRAIINGIYTIISDGEYTNSKVFFFDEMLRGVQSLNAIIDKDDHPRLLLEMVMLPNLVENNE
jgi:hypothetical protein